MKIEEYQHLEYLLLKRHVRTAPCAVCGHPTISGYCCENEECDTFKKRLAEHAARYGKEHV